MNSFFTLYQQCMVSNYNETGSAEYNLALGERRVNSAKNYLISLGISEDRIFTISCVRKDTPLDPGHDEGPGEKIEGSILSSYLNRTMELLAIVSSNPGHSPFSLVITNMHIQEPHSEVLRVSINANKRGYPAFFVAGVTLSASNPQVKMLSLSED